MAHLTVWDNISNVRRYMHIVTSMSSLEPCPFSSSGIVPRRPAGAEALTVADRGSAPAVGARA